MAPPMNQGQQELLAFLRAYIQEHGFPPTRKEILHGLRLRSWAWMDELLRQLEERGAIRVTPGATRGIVLCVPLEAPQWQGFETEPKIGQLVLVRSRLKDHNGEPLSYQPVPEYYAGPIDGWYYAVEVWGGGLRFWEQWRAVW